MKISEDPTPNGLTKRPRWFMSKSSWIAILCSSASGVFLIGFATSTESCVFGHLSGQSLPLSLHRRSLGCSCERQHAQTRELEEAFFAQRPGLRNRLTDKHLPLLEKHFKQGIAAYTVQPNGDFVLTHLPANYDKVGRPVLTIGIYAGHAFLIRDIKEVATRLHLWGLSGKIHKVLPLGSSCKYLQRWADQNQLPQQPHSRPLLSL